MDDLMKIDLYHLLNISSSADEKDIKKAYRKKALTCHPDKNPDNPKAAELFQQLSKALEILCDGAARAAYDKVLKARKASEVRHKELDSKRKKFKEDLEAKERSAHEVKEVDAAIKLQLEIDRLRKEGSKQLEEEKELLRQQIENERLGNQNKSKQNSLPSLKVKWKSHKKDEMNGGYSQEILQTIFSKYGQITCLISSKKRGSAVVEFPTIQAAQCAFESEKGQSENPLTLSWLSGQPEIPPNSHPIDPSAAKGPIPLPGKDSALTSRDYESLVLMKLRQAEERKRLIDQMMEDEN